MYVTSAREGGACNNEKDATTMAANLFVSTSVIRNSNQPSQKRSLIYGGQDPWYWFLHTACKLLQKYVPRMASIVDQMVKNLPAMRETQVRSLGQEEPLEKGMATYSSVLALRIPWTEEPGGLQSTGSQRIGHNWVTNTFTFHWVSMKQL